MESLKEFLGKYDEKIDKKLFAKMIEKVFRMNKTDKVTFEKIIGDDIPFPKKVNLRAVKNIRKGGLGFNFSNGQRFRVLIKEMK